MKVLVADDNLSFRHVLEKMLAKWGYQIVVAQDGGQAWELLQGDDPPRLAILDWMMPGLDGVEICRRLRGQNREPYIYILLVTAKDTAEELVEGMEAGADDYIRKPVNSHELRVRLRAGRRILDLQEELVGAREDLRRQATHDSLTDLWNRNVMFDIVDRELKRARREPGVLSILMADLDHFKLINDSLGHTAGDAVLREAARRMSACTRPYDAVCRYGGEEFLIVLPGCDLAGASVRAEEIRTAISGTPFQIPEGPVSVTCSLGVAAVSQPDSVDSSAVIREADDALYAAKKNGRNRVEAFSPVDSVFAH